MIDVRARLLELKDEKYKAFQGGLIPGVDNMIGVRIPLLRSLSRELIKDDFKGYLNILTDDYFEETLLCGMIIGAAKMDFDERIAYIKAFIPRINNWAVCDSFCSSISGVQKNKEKTYSLILEQIANNNPWAVRFAIVMLIDYFAEEDYLDKIFTLIDGLKSDFYYVNIAVAWLISVCFAKFPEGTMKYLLNNKLDKWTFNKSLQKILESRRVDDRFKRKIREMRI